VPFVGPCLENKLYIYLKSYGTRRITDRCVYVCTFNYILHDIIIVISNFYFHVDPPSALHFHEQSTWPTGHATFN